MINYLKTGASAILMTFVMSATALAAEPARHDAGEPVRTASVAAQTVEIVPRSNPTEDRLQQQPESNGWGMLAAGLAVGLLIITRRQRG